MRTSSPTIALIVAALSSACAMGPNDETLIPELRVMAIQADPPEANPGEQVALEVTIADPLGTGAEVLLWHCTDLGEGCLEEGTEHSWSLNLEGDSVGATASVPAALAAFATDEPLRAVQLWALACEPGLCPQVADPQAWDLSDPTAWLEELPMTGVSLAFDRMAISSREDGLENPTVQLLSPEPSSVAPGELVELRFGVQLDVPANADSFAYGYTTAGGFDATEYAIGDSGEIGMGWYAPDEPTTARLYVVAQDGVGGVAVWVGEVVVE
jgi:hypothetical protein